jgi:hypothetical protein
MNYGFHETFGSQSGEFERFTELAEWKVMSK